MLIKKMSIKKIVLLSGLVLLLLIVASTLSILGHKALAKADENGESFTLSSWFQKSDAVNAQVHFINVPNIMITLNGSGRNKHYLLLDLVLLVKDDGDISRVEQSLPLIKSATVHLLTNKDFQVLSNESLVDLRQSLLNEYQKEYALLKMTVPFYDVMISKLVFQ